MTQAAIVGLVAINLALGAIALWPKRNVAPEFRTLSIWQTEDGQLGAFVWMNGVLTPQQVELQSPYMGLKLYRSFTIEGREVDDSWRRSVSQVNR